MVYPRDNSVKLMIGIVVGTIVALAVGVTLYQMNNQVKMSAKAADPCEAYTKSGAANNSGTIQSLDTDRFTMAQDSGVAKIVVVCANAKFTKQFGGSYTYADLSVADKVSVIGFYGDATKTTILANLVRDTSVSKKPEIKENLKAKIPEIKTKIKEKVQARITARVTPPESTPPPETTPAEPICISEGSGSCATICANTFGHGCAGVSYSNCPCCGIDAGNSCETAGPPISCYCNP